MPELDLEQFQKKLEAGKGVPAVLLLGSDSFLRTKLRTLLIERLVPEPARGWAVQRLSAKDVSEDEILQQAQSMPMMSPQQVIFVEEADAWQKLGEESRERLVEALE